MGDRKSPILSPFRVFPRIPPGRIIPIFPGDEPIPTGPLANTLKPSSVSSVWLITIPGVTFPDQLFPDPTMVAWGIIDPTIIVPQELVPNPFTMTWNTVIPTVSSGASTLLNGLVSFWKLDEVSGTRVDAFASNDLTDNNTVTQASAGKIGDAAQFTRANSEYLSNASGAFDSGDIGFTMATWVWLDSKPSHFHIAGKWEPTADREYQLRFAFSRYEFNVSNTGFSTSVNLIASSFGDPPTGAWHFIVVWHDPVANTINIQVNNGTIDSLAFSGGPVVQSADFTIGSDTAGDDFDGRIDATAWYNRVLTVSERTELWNNGDGIEHPFA